MENLEKNEIIDAEETFYTVKSASLDTCTKQIRNNLTGIVKNFVKIGYLLNVIRQNEFYKESYKDIYEYAKKELGMSKTNVKNFTNIVLRFGKRNADGQITNELQDQYCEYSSSQLVELLSLPEEKHKEVTPDMTVRQIRDKKSEKMAGEPASEPCGESEEKPLFETEGRTENAILKERFDCAKMDIIDAVNAVLELLSSDFEKGKLPRGVYNTLSDIFGELGEQIRDFKL